MSSTEYQLYNQSVRRLVDTLVLKSAVTAERLNMKVRDVDGYPVSSDPKTWLYYLNLAGEYHPTQTPMTVVSLDTLTEISFDKETLLRHRATAKAYQYGTSYYYQLLLRYPTQRMLILGILNPINIDTAINAANHTILWYDQAEVDARESNLIPRMQYEIDNFFRRWAHPAYESMDMWYWPAIYGILFLGLPQMIRGIRWDNCHTNYAHSFHIWSFLASHQGLDKYKRYMTEKQILWFYRNIMYIERNMGLTDTYDTLIEHLLTDRGIPIGGFTVRQDSTNLPDNLAPEPYMERSPINLQSVVGTGTTRRDVSYVMQQEFLLATYNEAFYHDEYAKTMEKIEMTDKSVLDSKVLESEVEDLTDSELYPQYDYLLNEWIHLSAIGLYQAKITTTNPGDGSGIVLTMREAFKLFLYAVNAAQGIDLVEVPQMQANHVRVLQLPTFERLRGISDPQLISDGVINYCLDDQVDIEAIVSTEEFLNTVNGIYNGWKRHHQVYTLQEHKDARGMAEAIVENFYMDVGVDFDEGQAYQEWFQSKDWDFSSLNVDDWNVLAVDLITKATAQDLEDTTSLKDIQAGMLSLLKSLSSYTIHIIQTINSDPIKPLEWAMIRVGDNWVSGGSDEWYELANTKVMLVSYEDTEYFFLPNGNSEIKDWREDVVETHGSPGHARWYDLSGYTNTNYVNFTTQYWHQVLLPPFQDRFNNPLNGLYVQPYPGTPKKDFTDRFNTTALKGLWENAVKGFDTRFTKNPLDGLWIDPIYKPFDKRFSQKDLSGLDAVEFKPMSLRVNQADLNGLTVAPLAGPPDVFGDVLLNNIADGFTYPTLTEHPPTLKYLLGDGIAAGFAYPDVVTNAKDLKNVLGDGIANGFIVPKLTND